MAKLSIHKAQLNNERDSFEVGSPFAFQLYAVIS